MARFLGAGEAGSFDESVVAAALSTLSEACRNHERNRDHFLATNMAQVVKSYSVFCIFLGHYQTLEPPRVAQTDITLEKRVVLRCTFYHKRM